MTTVIQIPSIILPTAWLTGAELETLNDLVTHAGIDIDTASLQEKEIHIQAIEVVAAGIPGPLWLWVELSTTLAYLATVDPVYYAAIGGGGGALAPLAPIIVAPTGVNGTIHTLLLPWTSHSMFARLVAQMPVAATPLTDHWTLQAQFSAKGW